MFTMYHSASQTNNKIQSIPIIDRHTKLNNPMNWNIIERHKAGRQYYIPNNINAQVPLLPLQFETAKKHKQVTNIKHQVFPIL